MIVPNKHPLCCCLADAGVVGGASGGRITPGSGGAVAGSPSVSSVVTGASLVSEAGTGSGSGSEGDVTPGVGASRVPPGSVAGGVSSGVVGALVRPGASTPSAVVPSPVLVGRGGGVVSASPGLGGSPSSVDDV